MEALFSCSEKMLLRWPLATVNPQFCICAICTANQAGAGSRAMATASGLKASSCRGCASMRLAKGACPPPGALLARPGQLAIGGWAHTAALPPRRPAPHRCAYGDEPRAKQPSEQPQPPAAAPTGGPDGTSLLSSLGLGLLWATLCGYALFVSVSGVALNLGRGGTQKVRLLNPLCFLNLCSPIRRRCAIATSWRNLLGWALTTVCS